MVLPSTRSVLKKLREEGFRVIDGTLRHYIREFQFEEPLKSSNRYLWFDKDITRLKKFLIKKNRGPK